MNSPALESTSATLLGLLRDQPLDAPAWEEFVRRYRPRVYAFCLAFPLQAADAEDVTQTVMFKLVAKMRGFQYDATQSFRAWLKTVSRNVLKDYLAERKKIEGSGESAILSLLANVEAREGLAQQLEAEFDQELLWEAIRCVRPRVSELQWDAFRLTALEGLSGVDAAARLKILVASVYNAKSKVQKLVREEITRLEGSA